MTSRRTYLQEISNVPLDDVGDLILEVLHQ